MCSFLKLIVIFVLLVSIISYKALSIGVPPGTMGATGSVITLPCLIFPSNQNLDATLGPITPGTEIDLQGSFQAFSYLIYASLGYSVIITTDGRSYGKNLDNSVDLKTWVDVNWGVGASSFAASHHFIGSIDFLLDRTDVYPLSSIPCSRTNLYAQFKTFHADPGAQAGSKSFLFNITVTCHP